MSCIRIAIIGASGHGGVVLDAAKRSVGVEIVGFVDSHKPAESMHVGLPILGTVEEIFELSLHHEFSACVVAVGDNALRQVIVDRIQEGAPGMTFVAVIHPSAIIGTDVEVGEGSVILAGAIVNPGCQIGRCCILNTGSQLDHDSVIEDFSSLAPAAVTGGNVKIGKLSAIGLGAMILNSRTIGRETVIGAGSIVTRDIGDSCVAYGSPAKVVRPRKHGDPYL